MTDLAAEIEDDRSVELSSIVAIFPEIQIDPASPFKATLDLPVTLPSPTRFCFEQPLDHGLPAALTPPTSVDGTKAELGPPVARDVHVLLHLPPLSLDIQLPQGYPAEKPPVVRLNTHPPWLPEHTLERLTNDCERLWEECGRDMVVFTYIDHLQQLAESAFGIQDTPDGELCLSQGLKIALLEFNNKTEREKFEKETFECGVCLEPKKGANCYRLQRCSHVFCIPCLQDFYNTCIAEGDVDSVKCLAPDCDTAHATEPTQGDNTPRRKKRRTLTPSELLQIPLATDTVKRYVFLRRKKQIEADKTTVYCPRQWCQGAARSKRHPKPVDPMADDDASDDDESTADANGNAAPKPPVEERLAICEDCNYAFCGICRKGWHGEIVRCVPPRRQEELTEEEKATEKYLSLYTTPCPECSVPCQKRMGCNHMRCFQCNTHFCYLCSSWLDPSNPYLHFNHGDSACYNRLWELEGGDGTEPEGAEALHRIPDELLIFEDDDDLGSESDDDQFDDADFPVWDFDDDENDQIPPPPAPVPPRPNRGAARAAGPNVGRNIDPAARAAALERQAQAHAIAELRRREAAEQPRRERNRDDANLENFRNGLRRFLELVQNDREDEWDSDELDDDDF